MVAWLVPSLCLFVSSAAASTPSAQAHLGSGNQLMHAERYAEAADEFQQALRDDSALAPARDGLAICLFELRDYARARPLFEQKLETKPGDSVAEYYLGRMDLIDRNLASAIRHLGSIPREQAVRDELYFLGTAYYKQERYPESMQVLRRAAAENPRDSRVHHMLARAYQRLGKNEDAEKEFADTRRFQAYYSEGSVAIGGCRALLLKHEAEAAWAMCQPLTDTDDVDKIVAVGMLFSTAEQYGPALEAWQKAVALDPDSSEIQYNLALTYFHLKNMPLARKHAAEAVRQRPDFVEANILYGTILYMGAEDREALAALTHAHELKPDDAGARRLLSEELAIAADRYAQNEDWKQAAALLEKAVALQPDLPGISAKLAQVRAHLGQAR